MNRRLALVVSALVLGPGLVGCGGSTPNDGQRSTTTTEPSACQSADSHLTATRDGSTKSFEITDAVAVRVPVLPEAVAFSAADLSALVSKAKIAPQASYFLVISDRKIPKGGLSATRVEDLKTGSSNAIVIQIFASSATGVHTGDELLEGTEVSSTNLGIPSLGLDFAGDMRAAASPGGKASGSAKLVSLTPTSICVELDLSTETSEVRGTVGVPLQRANSNLFLT